MIRFGLVVGAAFVAVDPLGWDHFGPLRWALLSTLGFAAIAMSLGSGDVRLRPLPRWAVLGWLIVGSSMVVATVLSNDRWHAVIGTPDRHLGLAAWLLFAGLFATASMYPQTATRTVQRTLGVSAIFCGTYALLELGGLGWYDSDFAGERAGGPFGQPAFLGAAMVLAIPSGLVLALDREAGRLWQIAGLLGTALGTVALGASQARAAWVGAAVAAALVVLQRRKWLVGAVGLVLVVIVLFTTALGDRASSLTDLKGGVIEGRIDEWQVGVSALFDTPRTALLGYGPEGYRTVFGQHVDEAYVVTHGRDVVTDRAHSTLLDVSLAGGLVAGAGLALLQLGLVVTAAQRLRADDPTDAALGAGVLGYLVQQLFLFPLAELDPVLWILAGLLVARRPHRTENRPPLLSSVSGGKRTIMLAAGFLAAVSAVGGLSDVAADHAVRRVADMPDAQTALADADRARSRRPDSIRYDFIAARTAAATGTVDDFRIALERLDAGLTISPRDPALLAERGIVLLEIARRDGQETSLTAALEALDALDRTDPNNPATELTHGIALALADLPAAAISEFEHAAELDPDAIDPHLNLAVVYIEQNNTDAALAALDAVERLAPPMPKPRSCDEKFFREHRTKRAPRTFGGHGSNTQQHGTLEATRCSAARRRQLDRFDRGELRCLLRRHLP